MNIFEGFFKEVVAFGIGQDLAGVVIGAKGLLVFLDLGFEYGWIIGGFSLFDAVGELGFCFLAEGEAVEVVDVIVDDVFGCFSRGFVRGHD